MTWPRGRGKIWRPKEERAVKAKVDWERLKTYDVTPLRQLEKELEELFKWEDEELKRRREERAARKRRRRR